MGPVLDAALLKEIRNAHAAGQTIAVVTVVHQSGERAGERDKFIVNQGGAVTEFPSPAPVWYEQVLALTRKVLGSGKASDLVEVSTGEGSVRVAVEVLRPQTSLLIFGAGHVGHALALTAALVGYKVTVIDDRQEFLTRQRFPDTSINLVASPFDQVTSSLEVTSSTAIVIVTRGHQYDELCLKATIDSSACYIGMIGSKRRVIAVYRRLTEAGVDPEKLARVRAPIGLKIGAVSPQEIAVAILAEIIQTLSSRGASAGCAG